MRCVYLVERLCLLKFTQALVEAAKVVTSGDCDAVVVGLVLNRFLLATVKSLLVK